MFKNFSFISAVFFFFALKSFFMLHENIIRGVTKILRLPWENLSVSIVEGITFDLFRLFFQAILWTRLKKSGEISAVSKTRQESCRQWRRTRRSFVIFSGSCLSFPSYQLNTEKQNLFFPGHRRAETGKIRCAAQPASEKRPRVWNV